MREGFVLAKARNLGFRSLFNSWPGWDEHVHIIQVGAVRSVPLGRPDAARCRPAFAQGAQGNNAHRGHHELIKGGGLSSIEFLGRKRKKQRSITVLRA